MLLLIRLRGRGAVARCWGGAKAPQEGSVARTVDEARTTLPQKEDQDNQLQCIWTEVHCLHDLAGEPFHRQPHRFFILDQPEVIITSHP